MTDTQSDKSQGHALVDDHVEKSGAIPLPPTKPKSDLESSAMQASPRLSHRRLTLMLAIMCFVPVVTILTLWQMMPPVHEGQLEASVASVGIPPAAYYETHYSKRGEVPPGELLVKNESDQDWTHLNIQINRHYQIYDIEPIPAHSERTFRLDRFVSRTGARFQVRYNPLKSVRIYARRPTKDRATFFHEFEGTGSND